VTGERHYTWYKNSPLEWDREAFGGISDRSDRVGFQVLSKCAAPSYVVNIEILEAATYLTAPVIALQDFLSQPRCNPSDRR
jgi:hypothetical protein